MRTERQILRALIDSENLAKELDAKRGEKGLILDFKDLENGIKRLAVANEICTLKWVLKHPDSRMNCYEGVKE